MNLKRKSIGVIGSVCLLFLILGGTALSAKKVIHVWHTETNPLSRKAVASQYRRTL